MKFLHFAFFCLFFPTVAFSQTDKSDRNSLSLIRLNYPDAYSEKIRQVFDLLRLDERYDINAIPTRHIQVNGQRRYTDQEGNLTAPDRTRQIGDFLNVENIGLEIISYLFDRNPQTGQFSLERLYRRGAYNASDENIRVSRATKRGEEEIKEAGFNLIDRSYVLVYDYANIRYEYQAGSEIREGDYYWYASPAAYIFKIEWNEALQNKLFACWIDENTNSFEIGRRKKAFNQLQIRVKFIMRIADDDFSVCTGIEEQRRNVAKGGKRTASDETLKETAFTNLIYKAADALGEKIETKHADFHIQNTLYALHPLRAKIGKKENVRINDRYFVYEYQMKDDNTLERRRRGVVRATPRIADNRTVTTGRTPATEFYQIAGGRLAEGMTMEEKHSLHFNLDLGYRYGNLEGGYIGLSTNLYAARAANHNALLGVTVGDKTVTVTLDYGFGWRCNNFALYPYVGAGLDCFLNENDESSGSAAGGNRAWLAQGGARFDLNIYYPVQLFGGVEYNYLFEKGDAYLENMQQKDRDAEGVNMYGGLRICF